MFEKRKRGRPRKALVCDPQEPSNLTEAQLAAAKHEARWLASRPAELTAWLDGEPYSAPAAAVANAAGFKSRRMVSKLRTSEAYALAYRAAVVANVCEIISRQIDSEEGKRAEALRKNRERRRLLSGAWHTAQLTPTEERERRERDVANYINKHWIEWRARGPVMRPGGIDPSDPDQVWSSAKQMIDTMNASGAVFVHETYRAPEAYLRRLLKAKAYCAERKRRSTLKAGEN